MFRLMRGLGLRMRLNAKMLWRMNKNKAHAKPCLQCKSVFIAQSNRVVFCSLRCRLESETKRSNGCWLWTGHRDKDGYGRVRWHWREVGAHVAMWECEHGLVPAGMCVLHSCDNPPCVRPDHLWLGTQGDNVQDRHSKGRTRCNPRAGDNGRRAKRNSIGQFMCGV